MIRIEIERHIDRPIGEVFTRLADIARYPEWMPRNGLFVSCTQDTPGPPRTGTAYTDRTRLGTVHGEIAEYEEPYRVVFHYTDTLFGRVLLDGWPGYTLEPDGPRATRVHHRAEARLFGPYRLAAPLLRRIARAERRRTVDALKTSLEADGSG